MQVERLHHVQITIPKGSENEARKFYCGLLGLTEIPKPQNLLSRGGFWLTLGSQQLHVGVEDGVERINTKAHIAYEVSDLAEWSAKLRVEGFEISEGLSIPGYVRFESRDPFGNRFELIQKS